ncbi:MAG: DUF3313 domain-containing protein [Burkholderiales bacterium]
MKLPEFRSRTRARTACGLLAVVFTLGLAPALAQSEAKSAARPANSGFLGDYSKLKAAPDREGVMLYVDRSVKYRGYTKVMFRPVEVYVSPSAEYKGVQPDVLKRMTDEFLASFKRALEPGYQIVSESGPDVLQVRCAITGFQATKPPMNPTDILPIKAVFNMGRAAAGKSPQVAELTAEMEVLDNNNRRLAAAVATRKGDKTLQQGEQITWPHLQAITEYWAKGFRQRLDELRTAGGQ